MKVGNTLTVERRQLVDDGGAVYTGYVVALEYEDGAGARAVTVALDPSAGAQLFDTAELLAKINLAGRAASLAAAAAEADALSKGGK